MHALSPEVLLRPFPAWAVAVHRVVAGGAMAVVALQTGRTLLRLADPMTVQVPVVPSSPAVSPAPAVALALVWFVGAALFTVGLRTGTAAAVTVSAAVGAMLWDQQVTSNHLTLLVLLVALLGLADAGATLSLDARGRGGARRAVPFWPVLLVRTQVSTLYFFTALAKSNSEFLRGDVLEQLVPGAVWLAEQFGDWMLPALAVGAVATEYFLAIGLWFRVTRTAAVTAGVALHLGILLLIPEHLGALVPFAVATLGSYVLFIADDR